MRPAEAPVRMSFGWLGWLSQDFDVRAITRNPARAKVPDGANAIEGDVYDSQSYDRLAVMAYNLKRMANVLGTAHLTHALQKN